MQKKCPPPEGNGQGSVYVPLLQTLWPRDCVYYRTFCAIKVSQKIKFYFNKVRAL